MNRVLRFLRRHWVMVIAFCYVISYACLSFTGVYMPFRSGSIVISAVQFPDREIWAPGGLDVHEFRRWFNDPVFANLKEVPGLTLLFAPLVWIDWKLIHREHNLLYP